MKAARFHEYGDVDVLAVEDVPEPEPGDGEISLRVRAAGVNPIDWKILHGTVSGGEPLGEPRGLGVDVAGIVEKVGPGVSDVALGEELFGSPTGPAYAELALSRPELLLRKPPDVPWEIAGGLAVVVGTAFATLERLALKPGEKLLLAGASGGVGVVATQLALSRGVEVIGTASEAKQQQLRDLGAKPVVYGEGLSQRLREHALDGADAALDASGHGELSALVGLVADRERVLTIAGFAEAQQLGVNFHGGGGGELTAPALEAVLPLIEAGSFSFPIAGVYSLSQVGDALRESEHGHPPGKLIVQPG